MTETRSDPEGESIPKNDGVQDRVAETKREVAETGIPFPAIGNEAGNPVPRPNKLRGDGVKQKKVQKTMAPTS